MFQKIKQRKVQKELDNIKVELASAIDESIQSVQSSIEEVSKILSDFKKYKYSKHDSLFNLCIFSDVVQLDLIIMLEKMRLTERGQEKKLFARVMAVTIVDYLDNSSILIGNCLSELKKNNMVEFLDELKSIHRKFSIFKRDNEIVLRDIRNNTIAHKSKDALKLKSCIENIDVEEVYNFGLSLMAYTKEFVDLSTKIIYYIVDYMREGKRI